MDADETARRRLQEIEQARRQAMQDDVKARLQNQHETEQRRAREEARRLEQQILARARQDE
jgi:hypothetical protein